MQIVSCPSCGAEVKFRSHASVMAVCEYCSTSVLKDPGAVKDLGKMSSVLEDYSAIQIGTSGLLGGRSFTVVGRIQLRYAAGMWNEWYLLFDDGAAAWLGDFSGFYTITTEQQTGAALPAFEQIAPGRLYPLLPGAPPYTAAEVRVAECTGGQGELPFKVGQGYQARVADFRCGDQFLTLDYSDIEEESGGAVRPVVYTGAAVTLASLKCQLLRDDEQILHSAGKYRGKLDALDCPSCGTGIKYLPGVTATLICPACRTQIDAASPQAQVLAAGERVAAVHTSLELGAQTKLNNETFTIIGMMRRADDEGEEWDEYLLYGPRAGFSWLLETDQGWSGANLMPAWPVGAGLDAQRVQFDGAVFDKLYEYEARVVYAVGAFNWRVSAGDRVHVAEYGNGAIKLAAESTAEELGWSRSAPVPLDQMKAWFGKQFSGSAPTRKMAEPGRYQRSAKTIMMVMLAVNAVPLLVNFSGTWALSALGALAVYLPALYLDSKDDGAT
jgi:ribosomal protein S27E